MAKPPNAIEGHIPPAMHMKQVVGYPDLEAMTSEQRETWLRHATHRVMPAQRSDQRISGDPATPDRK